MRTLSQSLRAHELLPRSQLLHLPSNSRTFFIKFDEIWPSYHLVRPSADLLSNPRTCLAWKHHPPLASKAPIILINAPTLPCFFPPPRHLLTQVIAASLSALIRTAYPLLRGLSPFHVDHDIRRPTIAIASSRLTEIKSATARPHLTVRFCTSFERSNLQYTPVFIRSPPIAAKDAPENHVLLGRCLTKLTNGAVIFSLPYPPPPPPQKPSPPPHISHEFTRQP